LKEITDLQEKAKSRIEELAGYANARADALEKLKLPSASSSVTKSVSTGTTDGKKEDKTSESTEDKTTTNDSSGVAYASRVAALIACDVLYYAKAQRAFQSIMTAYAGMLDFLDKNQEKLERPKGSGGSHSGFASMY
jgi:urease gamma subunit